MSSGPFTQTLSTAAAFVLRSLVERPDLERPEQIANAPNAAEEIDADGAREGLRELASRGLAAEDADGCWRLTDAGRAAHPRP